MSKPWPSHAAARQAAVLLGQEASAHWLENRVLEALCLTPWPLPWHALAELVPCHPKECLPVLMDLVGRGLVEYCRLTGERHDSNREYHHVFRARREVRDALYFGPMPAVPAT